MNVVGYIRVSTEEQAEHGHSLAAQETLIRQFAQSRGWQVGRIYCDSGLSGRSDQRPALTQMLEDVATGQFEAVVVHAVDRLYRNLEALLKSLHVFQTHRVAFVSITENMDFTTPWGKLTLAVLGTLAEIYIDKLSAETSKGKQQRARQGLWNGSISLGYCNGRCSHCTDPNGPGYCPNVGSPDQGDGKNLIFHPIEQVAVRLAYQWYVTGDYSDSQIAAKLNAYEHQLPDGTVVHFRTKRFASRGGPGPFSKDSVREILTRIFYTGQIPYYGSNAQGHKRKRWDLATVHTGQHSALIDQETFERAQEVRRILGRYPRQRQQTTARLYLLSGILHCGQCWGKMRAQTGSNGRNYYICVTRQQRTGPCTQPAIPAHHIELQLLDFLKHIKLSPDWQRQIIQASGQDPDEVDRKQAEIKGRLERATELYLSGLLTKERFEQERRQCEYGIADLQNKDISAILAAEIRLKTLQEQGLEPITIEKRKLLRGLFAAVFARGDTLSAIRFTEAMYPLVVQAFGEACIYSGSDGT